MATLNGKSITAKELGEVVNNLIHWTGSDATVDDIQVHGEIRVKAVSVGKHEIEGMAADHGWLLEFSDEEIGHVFTELVKESVLQIVIEDGRINLECRLS